MNISVTDNTASIVFNQFDIAGYEAFLRCKRLPEHQLEYDYEADTYTITTPARYASLLGLEVVKDEASDLPLAPFLFDDQQAIVKMALEAKRFAIWSDCGLGKTLEQLEFARQVIHRTGGRVLIMTLNEIVSQTIDETRDFYGEELPIYRIESREEMRIWCKEGPGQLAITNYEKMNPDETGQIVSELRYLSGLILDESSRLKAGGGKQKWAIIKSARGIPYKLSCTATPAPNDTIEFASQASFLERMRNEGEIIWTYFARDPKTKEWTVKRHARKAFFEWMSSWSIYVRDPKRYGWRKDMELPPEPVMLDYKLPLTDEQQKTLLTYNTDNTGQTSLFTERNMGIVARSKLSQIAKGFVYEGKRARKIDSRKPEFIANLIQEEVARGLQVLVWTIFDTESEIIVDELLFTHGFTSFAVLNGSIPRNKRQRILDRFRTGQSRVLISKASLLGFGMNFQMCGSMIFSGWNDSYEQMYQAVRRAVRFGQDKQVRVHIPFIPELEGMVLDNVFQKQQRFEESVAEMELSYISAMKTLKLAEGL